MLRDGYGTRKLRTHLSRMVLRSSLVDDNPSVTFLIAVVMAPPVSEGSIFFWGNVQVRILEYRKNVEGEKRRVS